MIPLNDCSHGNLAAAADNNFVTHATWVQQRTPGMRVVAAPDLVLVDSGLPCDTFNLVCGGVVGLYNIVTLAGYRRRGIGIALTLQPLLDARAHGYNRAILQALNDGVRVYTRVGFELFGQIREYKHGVPDDRALVEAAQG